MLYSSTSRYSTLIITGNNKLTHKHGQLTSVGTSALEALLNTSFKSWSCSDRWLGALSPDSSWRKLYSLNAFSQTSLWSTYNDQYLAYYFSQWIMSITQWWQVDLIWLLSSKLNIFSELSSSLRYVCSNQFSKGIHNYHIPIAVDFKK